MTIRPVVLAVDDDPGVLRTYRAILESRYDVITVGDGRSALAVLAERTVDVTLLDILMPGLSGLAVLEAIRRMRFDTSVVVVSGATDSRMALEALRLGARDYLSKPFHVTQLQQVVQRLAARDATTAHGAERSPLPHALIVSEDFGLRAGLTVALRTRSRVDGVSGATAARAVLGRIHPDVVVIDAPGGDQRVAMAVRERAGAARVTLTDSRRPDFESLLSEVSDGFAVRHAEAQPFRAPVPSVIGHVCRYYRDVTEDGIAFALGIPAPDLAGIFADQMAITVREFVTHVKIDAAKTLLRETDTRIEAIPDAVGLYDPRHLAQVFRQHDPRTPASYRLH
jgi:DNA-binding response OmpR family regulator/AraC-like DNA-binding protein